ncbi:MAG: D-alanine--D-alanine ligase family protein [Rhodoglobus sp.]|nr:D-alanine--D-alanine ligase family protein [Rhodoglobus sp.]
MIRVAVIGGGENCEHDVSLASVASVRSALDPAHYDVVELTIGRDGQWRDARGAALSLARAIDVLQLCAVAFPLVHGPRGEDGSLAALLDFARVPYVGSGVGAGALAMDKWATKLIAEAVGVRTAPGGLVGGLGAGLAAGETTYPAIVKPVAAGSSFGVSRVDDAAGLADAIVRARELDDRVLVESFIEGREIDIAVLTRADGSRMLSAPLEIVKTDALFDTAAKYDGTADFRVSAALSAPDLDDVHRQALAVHDALGCAGVARIDFFLTDDGLVLNEVNTMPGMTAQSQVPRMFEAVGLPYAELLDELIAGALVNP